MCFVSTESLENKTIYGATLKRIPPISYRISLQNEPHLLKRVGFVLQKVFFLLCQPRRQGAIGAVSDRLHF